MQPLQYLEINLDLIRVRGSLGWDSPLLAAALGLSNRLNPKPSPTRLLHTHVATELANGGVALGGAGSGSNLEFDHAGKQNELAHGIGSWGLHRDTLVELVVAVRAKGVVRKSVAKSILLCLALEHLIHVMEASGNGVALDQLQILL